VTFCELARRAGEVGCCDKHSLGRFRRTQAPAKRTDFWLAYRGVLFVPLGLYVNTIKSERVLIDHPIDASIAALTDAVGGHKFGQHFLLTEWEQIVDAWQLENWEAYRDVVRLGRKTRLPEAQRAVLWSIFEGVRAGLKTRNLITHADMFGALAVAIGKSRNLPFDFAVVDEAQDITISQLRFLAMLGANRVNALFFAGDLGQRIFQQPFSWKALGVDIRGRSRTLRVNYRTSHQIRTQADRLLAPAVSDVDGNSEDRSDTVSVFNGPPPAIRVLTTESNIRSM
jgi:superfamily I DNA/RNA helicase